MCSNFRYSICTTRQGPVILSVPITSAIATEEGHSFARSQSVVTPTAVPRPNSNTNLPGHEQYSTPQDAYSAPQDDISHATRGHPQPHGQPDAHITRPVKTTRPIAAPRRSIGGSRDQPVFSRSISNDANYPDARDTYPQTDRDSPGGVGSANAKGLQRRSFSDGDAAAGLFQQLQVDNNAALSATSGSLSTSPVPAQAPTLDFSHESAPWFVASSIDKEYVSQAVCQSNKGDYLVRYSSNHKFIVVVYNDFGNAGKLQMDFTDKGYRLGEYQYEKLLDAMRKLVSAEFTFDSVYQSGEAIVLAQMADIRSVLPDELQAAIRIDSRWIHCTFPAT